jgi:hypothetical protein
MGTKAPETGPTSAWFRCPVGPGQDKTAVAGDATELLAPLACNCKREASLATSPLSFPDSMIQD